MIIARIQQGFGQIILNRPQTAHALTASMLDDALQALHLFSQNSSVKGIELSATGQHFCAGADLNWLEPLSPHARCRALAPLQALCKQILQCPKPVRALCHGAVRGGGVGLVAACHHVIAGPHATFACPEAKRGITPTIITPFVQRKMQSKDAQQMLDACVTLTATEAKHQGLITDIAYCLS